MPTTSKSNNDIAISENVVNEENIAINDNIVKDHIDCVYDAI